jgi:hypothetical protein
MHLSKKLKTCKDSEKTLSTKNQTLRELPCGFSFKENAIKHIDSKFYVNCNSCLRVHFVESLRQKNGKNESFNELLREHFQLLEQKVEVHRQVLKAQMDIMSNEILSELNKRKALFKEQSKTIICSKKLELQVKKV